MYILMGGSSGGPALADAIEAVAVIVVLVIR